MIVRHEIVLGRADRELLDTAVTAYTANRVLTPITDMLSSTPGLLLLAGLALSYGEKYLPENWSDMDDTQLADWFETEEWTEDFRAELDLPGYQVQSKGNSENIKKVAEMLSKSS